MNDIPDEATLLRTTLTNHGESLEALSTGHTVLLVLLRHEGCIFCRNAMSDIARSRPRIEAAGATIVLGHMGTPEEFAAFAGRYGLSGLPAVADPDRQLYRGLGLRRGNLWQMLRPRVWCALVKSLVGGHRIGRTSGDPKQMPGAFLIKDGRVLRRHEYSDAADKPDYVDFVRPLDAFA